MCTAYEEGIKGQSNRELLSDFNRLIGSAMTLTLGPEIGAYHAKPRNATDAQQMRALEVIVQGMSSANSRAAYCADGCADTCPDCSAFD